MIRTEFLAKLDEAIARRNLLQHPFYQDWQAGTLSREKLRFYAKQYYLHVEAFPVYLKLLADRAKGSLRELILENLADEEDRAAPHARLWRDFAVAIGVSEVGLWTSTPLPGIRRLTETYSEICSRASLSGAVAALYAYESQVPEISATKIDGLRRYYGVTTEKGLAYFKVHEEADRVHRAAWRRWLEKSSESSAGANDETILTTARSALDALWRALDSIQETVA